MVLVVFAVLRAGMWDAADASPVVAAMPVAVVVAAERVMKARRDELFGIRLLAFHHSFAAVMS